MTGVPSSLSDSSSMALVYHYSTNGLILPVGRTMGASVVVRSCLTWSMVVLSKLVVEFFAFALGGTARHWVGRGFVGCYRHSR